MFGFFRMPMEIFAAIQLVYSDSKAIIIDAAHSDMNVESLNLHLNIYGIYHHR